MPIAADPAVTGYLQQTDSLSSRASVNPDHVRANYRKLIGRMVRYTGDSVLVRVLARPWAGVDAGGYLHGKHQCGLGSPVLQA